MVDPGLRRDSRNVNYPLPRQPLLPKATATGPIDQISSAAFTNGTAYDESILYSCLLERQTEAARCWYMPKGRGSEK